MSHWGISAFRGSNPFVRGVAAFVIVTFAGLVTSPAVAATRAEIERQEHAPTSDQTDDQNNDLSGTLLDIKRQLKAIAVPATAGPGVSTQTASEVQADRTAAREALKALRTQLRDLDKAAREDFRAIEKTLKAKNVPEVILQRHADAVAKYQAEAEALLQGLASLETAGDDAVAEQAAAILSRLERTKLRRSQQPFDPKQLPNRSLPAERKAPKFMVPHFINAEAFPDDLINLDTALAAIGDFDFSGLAGADDPALLGETVEVVLSDAIRAKAESLDHDPVKIYNWVRDNIQWQPTWGAVQDADLTLSAQRGNAFDIASLLIALLRASGIPARYTHGTIEVDEDKFRNWIGGFQHIDAAIDYAASGGIPIRAVTSGGKITKVRLEHVWVEAAIDFYPSRGAVNRKADTWVQLDGSYKQYEYLAGLDPVAISGLDPEALASDFLNSGTVNEEDGWVTGFDPAVLQNAQTQAQQALEDHIEQDLPDATVGDVLGGRKIIAQGMPILAGWLDNKVIVSGMRYAALPGSLRQHITFGFGADILGEPQQSVRFPWAQLNNQRITLSFRPATQADEDALRALLPEGDITDISQLPTSIPAYLINVIPELKVNDEVVMTGSTMKLGEELTFVFTPEFAGRYAIPNTYNVIAGSYLAVAVVAGNVSPQVLEDSKVRLEGTKSILEAQNSNDLDKLTREDLLGDLFHAGLLGYYGQYTGMSYVAGFQQGNHHYLAAGIGSYGYEPAVEYFFGTPRKLYSGGSAMNIPIVNIYGHDNDGSAEAKQNKLNYVLQIGTLSSALEHIVPEQMFVTEENPGEAISAVKALSKASQAGQRIYHITNANKANVLPNIHHDSLVMNEIRNALAVGKEVITHTDDVSVPGWNGAGYIIYDPVTGDGAYKIGGGANGSFLMILLTILLLAVAFFPALAAVSILLNPLFLTVALLLVSIEQFYDGLDCDAGPGATALYFAISVVSAFFPGKVGSAIFMTISSWVYTTAIVDGVNAVCKVGR